MKRKFLFSICFGGLWLAVSGYFAIGLAQEVSYIFPDAYLWWVIIGIALLPGFLMSSMFFSNLLHWKLKEYPDTQEDTARLGRWVGARFSRRIGRSRRPFLIYDVNGVYFDGMTPIRNANYGHHVPVHCLRISNAVLPA